MSDRFSVLRRQSRDTNRNIGSTPTILYTHTKLAPKLTAMTSVAQLVERWSKVASRVQFPVGVLGVAYFTSGPGWV